MALSPREPAQLRAGAYGTAGRAAPAGTDDPTAGRPVTGETPRRYVTQDDRAGRPRSRVIARNTMSRATMSSGVRRRASAGEWAAPALERPSVPPMARVNPGRRIVPGMEEELRLAGERENFRRRAMRDHSVQVSTGADAVDTVLQRVYDPEHPYDPPRRVAVSVPVWDAGVRADEAWALLLGLAGE